MQIDTNLIYIWMKSSWLIHSSSSSVFHNKMKIYTWQNCQNSEYSFVYKMSRQTDVSSISNLSKSNKARGLCQVHWLNIRVLRFKIVYLFGWNCYYLLLKHSLVETEDDLEYHPIKSNYNCSTILLASFAKNLTLLSN